MYAGRSIRRWFKTAQQFRLIAAAGVTDPQDKRFRSEAAGRRLLEQARLTAGEPGHGVVVQVLRARLESGIAAGL